MPPGRLIPTKQLWGGNPVKFMKDLDVGESWANYTKSYVVSALGEGLKDEFTLWNSSYMDRVSYQDDVEPEQTDVRPIRVA